MDSTHYTEIHLIHQATQNHTVVQLGGLYEHGQADWVLDQTGVDYSRFRFVGAGDGVRMEYLEGDGSVMVDGSPMQSSVAVYNGSVVRIDNEEFRLELRQQRYEAAMPSIDAGWMTITGSVREHNEDAVGIYQDSPYHLFIVCDGVGGAEAGEIISEFAVKYLLYEFERYRAPNTDWASVFRTAVKAINDEARRYAQFLSEQSGKRVQAGCTLTAIALNGWDAQIVHVGDSRMYLQHDGVTEQISIDHSTFPSETGPVPTMDAGQTMMTKRNVLIKGIGKSDQIEPDLKQMRLSPGDKLLLCSDGMSDRVNTPEINGLIDGMSPQKLAAHLAKTADERRSGDNVSVVVVRVNAPGQAETTGQAMPQQRAFVGPQQRPRLSTVSDVATDFATNHGGSRLPLHIIIPVVIVILILIIIVALILMRGGA
jgi:serine/threonine protein phosphatase PrpC